MRPGRFEVGTVALRVLVKMDAMFAGREILEVEFHPSPGAGFRQNRGAYSFTLGIFELNDGFRRAERSEC